MIVKSESEVEKLHEMRLVGMTQQVLLCMNKRAWTYDVNDIGYRYHMSNMHAAIGIQQLRKHKLIETSRRELCKIYNEHLGEVDKIIVPRTNFADVVPFLYYIRVPAEDRDQLVSFV